MSLSKSEFAFGTRTMVPGGRFLLRIQTGRKNSATLTFRAFASFVMVDTPWSNDSAVA